MFTRVLRLALVLTLACSLLPAHALAGDPKRDKETKALVAAAAKLIKAKGEAAFGELRQPGSKWFQGERFVFVGDDKGVELVNPAAPELEGKNLWDYKDEGGKLVIQDQWKLIKAKGKGWYECLWPKPGQTKAAPCRSYVQGVKVKGKTYLVGSAYWL